MTMTTTRRNYYDDRAARADESRITADAWREYQQRTQAICPEVSAEPTTLDLYEATSYTRDAALRRAIALTVVL